MKDTRIRTQTAEGELVGANTFRDPSLSETELETAERIYEQHKRGLARWNENHPDEPNHVWEAQVADSLATLSLRRSGDNKTMIRTATRSALREIERAFYAEPQHTDARRPKEAPTTPSSGEDQDDAPSMQSILDLANSLGRKLEVGDLDEALYEFAVKWLAEKPTPISFEFLRDLREKMDDGKELSYPQAKGVLNCVVADARRGVRGPAPTPGQVPTVATTTPGPDEKPQRAALAPGIYVKVEGDNLEPTVIKVQAAIRGSGHLYAKRLITKEGEKGKFEYEPGLITKLTPEDRMTLEQAKKFGEIYGVCGVCGALLTNEESIEAGIGPVCAGKL